MFLTALDVAECSRLCNRESACQSAAMNTISTMCTIYNKPVLTMIKSEINIPEVYIVPAKQHVSTYL